MLLIEMNLGHIYKIFFFLDNNVLSFILAANASITIYLCDEIKWLNGKLYKPNRAEMLTQSKLIKFCTSILKKLGVDDEKANDTSEILVEADMMGHSTHGVRLLPLYIKDIEAGNMNITGNQTILNDTGSCVTINGDKLPGIWLTKRGLKLSSERSKIHGVSTILIKNSHE